MQLEIVPPKTLQTAFFILIKLRCAPTMSHNIEAITSVDNLQNTMTSSPTESNLANNVTTEVGSLALDDASAVYVEFNSYAINDLALAAHVFVAVLKIQWMPLKTAPLVTVISVGVAHLTSTRKMTSWSMEKTFLKTILPRFEILKPRNSKAPRSASITLSRPLNGRDLL